MSDLLKGLKVDCEKVIQNLVDAGCDEAWSIIKLNNMIQDIDDGLQQPTIADYLEANKEMIDKTGCKVVTIASLKRFGGLE